MKAKPLLQSDAMLKPVKKIIITAFILVSVVITASHAEIVDKIVVIVDDEIITQGEIDRILLPIYQQYSGLYSGDQLAEKIEEVRQNIIQKLVNDKLLLTEAKRREVQVSERELEDKVDEVRARFSSEKEFMATLAQENMLLSDLKDQYRERMMIDKLIDAEIRRKISVAPHEVLNFYEESKQKFSEPERVKLRSLLIRVNGGRTDEAALELSREILERLNEGGDFALLAQEYSDGPYADSGGDMGWVRKGELMKKIDTLVFNMQPGEISGVLKTNLGYHIFKVEEKAAAQIMSFDEAKDVAEQMLFTKKTEEKLKEWLKQLKKNAYIAFR